MADFMELLRERKAPVLPPVAAVFDFDGTISTLRCGWENVMAPLMLECIAPEGADDALKAEVAAYIDRSTGIQTIHQMRWLADRVKAARGKARDPWEYKAEYNRRLLLQVEKKKQALETGAAAPEDHLIGGATAFLSALKDAGVQLYLASGTDHEDVVKEAALLGADGWFTRILGAPEHAVACAKETVLRQLFDEGGIDPARLLVVGDGKVEISLGHARGALTLGAATDERRRRGVDPVKRARLIAAGADAIVGDFCETGALLRWLGF